MANELRVMKLSYKPVTAAAGDTAADFLFIGNKNIYASTELTAAKCGVALATKADEIKLKVINTVEQLIVAGVAERIVARGVNGTKKQNRHFIVSRGYGEGVEIAIETAEAGVVIDGLTCKSASTPRNYALVV